MRISPGPREHIFVDGERSAGDAELSQSQSKKFQIILGQWQGSALKDGFISGYNSAIERRQPQSSQIVWDVLLSPIYKVEHDR